jgi:hypothetical protein
MLRYVIVKNEVDKDGYANYNLSIQNLIEENENGRKKGFNDL